MAPPPGRQHSLDPARAPSSRKTSRRSERVVAAPSLPRKMELKKELINHTTPETSDTEDNDSVWGILGTTNEDVIEILPRLIKSPEFYIDELLSQSKFDSDQVAQIQQRTWIIKQQRLDIKDELTRMYLIIHGKSKFQEPAVIAAAAAKSYHHYLESEGFFENEPTFVTHSESSHANLHTSTMSDGTIFIEKAEKLCSTCISSLKSIRSKRKIALVFSLTTADIPRSLSTIVTKNPLRLEFKEEPQFDPFTCAHVAFLKCLDDKYKGRMKLEGGRDGPHIRLCLRRLLKSAGKCTDKSKIETAVASAFGEMIERQFKRLTEPKSLRNPNEDPDALFLNAADILGANPGSAEQISVKEWTELQKLVGLDSVKQSVQSHMSGLLINHYRELNEHEPLKVGLSRLFIGPPGTGKTTVATLYGRILAKMGILSNGELMVKNASDFIGKHIGSSAARTTKILTAAAGKVLLIDEAYMLNPKRNKNCQFRQEAIDTIVGQVTNAPGEDLCVILCGYKKEMEELVQDANPGFRRRFPIDDAFVFEDFTDSQLSQILDLQANEQQLEVSKEGREIAMKALKLAKQRPDFGNGGEVVNVVSRAVTNFRNRIGPELSASTESSRIKIVKETKLDAVDFDPEYTRTLAAEQEVEHQFRDMVGIDAQIGLFRSWARRAENMIKSNVDPKPFIPFAFVSKGPPGCGKTTFARRLGKLYFKMGLLATSEVVEVSTKDMIAGYIGQTALKTRELLEKSLGKVLFIDEAYRLKGRDRHDHSSGSVFAAEARDELVDAMTKPMFLGKIVIVLAGYEDRMDDMLSENPGLRSRFRTQVRFPALSASSCVALLKKTVAGSSVKITLGKHEAAIENVFQNLGQTKGWGNGRDVEDIAKEVVGTVFENLVDNGRRAVDGRMVLETIRRWCTLQNIDLPTSNGGRRNEDALSFISGQSSAPSVVLGPSRAPPPAQEVSMPPPNPKSPMIPKSAKPQRTTVVHTDSPFHKQAEKDKRPPLQQIKKGIPPPDLQMKPDTIPPAPKSPPAQKEIPRTPHIPEEVAQRVQPVGKPVPPKVPLNSAYFRDESFKKGIRKAFEHGNLLSSTPPLPPRSKAKEEVSSTRKLALPNLPTPKPIGPYPGDQKPDGAESPVERPRQSPFPAKSLLNKDPQFLQTTRPDLTIPKNSRKQKVTPSSQDLYAFPLDRDRKETRLLSIVPGDGDVSYRLQTISLLDKPVYYALSYVWGDPKDSTTILVNGHEIEITSNLKAALARLQTYKKGHYCRTGIWVDALCVNQNDNSDKSYQIPMMEDIYSNARRVVAWLGPEDANNTVLEKHKAVSKLCSQQSSIDADKNTRLEVCMDASRSLKHSNSFWSRIWIVQELCIPITPPSLLSSRNAMDLDKFLDAHDLTSDALIRPSPRPRRDHNMSESERFTNTNNHLKIIDLANVRRSIHIPVAHTSKPTKRIDSDTLLFLASLSRNRAASNPSDRVYGLLGMIAHEYRKFISVDYTLHYMEAYRDFFSILWTSADPVVVEFFDYQPSDGQFPSWVSDISQSSNPARTLDRPDPTYWGEASWDQPWSHVPASPATIASNGKLLSVNGVPLGTVLGTESAHTNWDSDGTPIQFEALDEPVIIECLEFLRHLETRVRQLAANVVLDNILVEYVLSLNGIPPMQMWEAIGWSEVTTLDKSDPGFFGAFWDLIAEQPDIAACMRELCEAQAPDAPELGLLLVGLLAAVQRMFSARELVFTSTGIVCHAPARVQQGDVVVMLWGSTRPVILREDDAGPWFKIVGFAPVLMWRKIGFADMLNLCGVRNMKKFVIG